ncbi:phage gene 29 protein family protein [Nocardia farcinica]|uniref:phage gene 29 protein family protein n=1 Tax=Nocardia farcinica TaxID=37329 RepID=UPI0018939220|nr:DUF2744 domain-containing protein [Nocardia farcinica]
MAPPRRRTCPVCGKHRCPCEYCHTDCGLDHSPTLPTGAFPTTALCNPNCPDEAFLPYLVGLPGMKGAAMALPLQYLKMWSRRLWDGGARIAAEPVIFYHPPRAGEISPMFAAGEWKPEPPEPSQATGVDIDRLGLAVQAELARQIDEKRAAAEPPPKKPGARVGRIARFQPQHHTVTEVLTYLRTASPSEVERVLDAEQAGAQRAGILKRRSALTQRGSDA